MQAERFHICTELVLYVLVAGLYSVATPLMEASDELWHYPMVKYIADHRALPVQDPEHVGAWRQEGSQPPLYYAVSALLTAWIDTSDVDEVRRLNPHADNGIIREDGNTNLIVHQPGDGLLSRWADDRSSRGSGTSGGWRGTALAIHLIRLISVAMGAVTVYCAYLLVLEVWTGRTWLALAAAALTGFNPMFSFISGAVNNDNLAMSLCALGVWLLVRLVGRHSKEGSLPRSSWWRDAAVLGVVLGLAVLTKSSAMGLLPLTALAIGYVSRRRRSWWHFLTGGLVTAGLVVALSGWWFARNAVLYDGDWLGIERFIEILGYRSPPATLRQLWGERHGFMMAYWGLFGGVNVPLPTWVYAVLNSAMLLAVAGLGVAALRRARPALGSGGRRTSLDVPPGTFQRLLLALWPVLVVIPWAVWATRTWSSQGRLVFSAITAWSAWMALGLSQLGPRRWASLLPGVLGAFMLGVAAWAPFGVIAPAYQPPILPAGTEPRPTHVLRADVGGQLSLLGYDIEDVSASGEAVAHPGEAFRFTLYWEALGEMSRNWSVFCHILDLDLELPVATRDRFPGQGLLATSSMVPGQRWADRYVVWLPNTAYAPSRAVLEVGLYDAVSQERPPILVLEGEGTSVVGNGLRFQPLRIEPLPGDAPNAVQINFEDRMALVGWDVDRRVVGPGDEIHLTLFWDRLAEMEEDYTASVQVVTPDGRKAAQSDVAPGGIATSVWQAGQRVVDRRELAVYADAPPGGYEVRVMVYGWTASQALERLRVIDAEGRVLPMDYIVLGSLRVAP